MAGVILYRLEFFETDATLDPAGWHMVYQSDAGTVSPLIAADVSVACQHFVTSLGTGQTKTLANWMGNSLNRGTNWTWTAYDITSHLAGTPYGAPINSNGYSYGTYSGTSNAVPEGVAACLSFRRDYGTDVEFVRDPVTHKVIQRPRARDRGRVFFGPLDYLALTRDVTTARTKLASAFQADLLAALSNAKTISDSSSNTWKFVHWSKKKGSVSPIVLAWVDDRPDYQRRRSDQSTARASAVFSY